MTRFIISILLLGICLEASELPSIGDLLPESGAIVDIMKATVSERCDSLVNEWKATVAQDTEWYLRYVEKHSDLKDGEILPYNPKFGITEREYYEMVECLSSPSFKKVAEDEFVIVKEGSVYRIDSANIIRDFINLRLDEESMVLEGYFGRIDQCDTVISREAPIGTWTGYSWSEEEGDVQNGRLITFFLGFFDGTSRGLIGFKLRIIKDGVLVAGCDWKIFFESGV